MLLALLFASLALANSSVATQPFTNADLRYRKETLSELNQLFGEIDAETDQALNELAEREKPKLDCAPVLRGYDALRRFSPPKNCPKAAKYYDFVVIELDGYVDVCRGMERFLDSLGPEERHATESEVCERTRSNFSEIARSQRPEDEEEPWDAEFDSMGTDQPTGEMRRMECQLPLTIILQGRKKLSGIVNKLKGGTNAMVDDFCKAPGDAAYASSWDATSRP